MFEVRVNRASNTVEIGRQGENNARGSLFDISDWIEEFGEGNVCLTVVRPNEEDAYLATIEREGNYVKWIVKKEDVEIVGNGEAQLSYVIDGTIVKSEIYKTDIKRSLGQDVIELTPVQQSFIEQAIKLNAVAQQFAKNSQASAAESEASKNQAGVYAEEAKSSAKFAEENKTSAALSAESAIGSANSASQSATEAKSSENEARQIAQSVGASANEAKASANSAKQSELEAEQSAKSADESVVQAKSEAQKAQNSQIQADEKAKQAEGFSNQASEFAEQAKSLKDQANNSALESLDYSNNAKSSAEKALNSENQAKEAVNHYPKIQSGMWYVWDSERNQFVSTGVKAEGKNFRISKTYSSVAEMNADFNNPDVELGGFVLIDTGNVNDEDNAKLYIKSETGYMYLTDLSGSQGIAGMSAYEIAVQEGFTGTLSEWLDSLAGESSFIEVKQTEDGVIITAKDKSGTTSAQIKNGKDGVVDVTGASAGQIIEVAEVDSTGRPTKWIPVDKPQGAQSDWNENDETNPAFVKNRPGGYFGKETELIPKQNFAFADEESMGVYIGVIPTELKIVAGNIYRIVWDEANYNCIAYNVSVGPSTVPSFGNASLLMPDVADTGEPFVVAYGNAEEPGINMWIVGTSQTEPSHDIQIFSNEIVKIPNWLVESPEFPKGAYVGKITTEGGEVFNNGLDAGKGCHAEGNKTYAFGGYSHSEGSRTETMSVACHAEGFNTVASGRASHAEGGYYDLADEPSEWNDGDVVIKSSSAEGKVSHAEGASRAVGNYSHSEGMRTVARMNYSHAEGIDTKAEGLVSHVEGARTIAYGNTQHVQGEYNIPDLHSKYSHIVGNGNLRDNIPSNAHTLDWFGNGWYQKSVRVAGEDMDAPQASLDATGLTLTSSTPDSVKQSTISVDDTGTLQGVTATLSEEYRTQLIQDVIAAIPKAKGVEF